MFKKSSENKEKRQEVSWHKYLSLLIPIVLLLSVAIVGLSMVGIYSRHITQESNRLSAMDRATYLSNNIQASIHSISLMVRELRTDLTEGSAEYIEAEDIALIDAENLRDSTKELTANLNALKNGGKIDIDGVEINIVPSSDKEINTHLNSVLELWQPYQNLANSVVDEILKKNYKSETSKFAAGYVRVFGERIHLFNLEISKDLRESIEDNNRQLRSALWTGFFFLMFIFVYFLLISLRRLFNADRRLESAQQEMREIMNSVQEGLFLISPDLTIGEQHSKQLNKILPVRQFAGKSFEEIVEPMVSAADLINTKRFINQLFTKKVRENLINDLNPLNRVAITVEGEDATFDEKYLRFHFSRVYENKKIAKVLASVTDITESVVLQKQLEEEKAQNQAYTEMLMKVLLIDPNLLDSFVRNARKITERINEVLRRSDRSQSGLRTKVDDIFREVHSFKGEASALQFDSFVGIAEEAEDKLKQLRAKSNLSGDDFLGIAVSLDSLMNVNKQLQVIQEKLAEFAKRNIGNNPNAVPTSSSNGELVAQQMELFSQQIADRNNKRISFTTVGFKESNLPVQVMDTVKEISIQLLRNAIVHGIETPTERQAVDKNPMGHIRATLSRNVDGQYELKMEDDGQGINLDKLREKLKNYPQYKDVDTSTLSDQELYRSLFLPGLSTAEEASQDAGRGEGMSIIRERIKELKQGRIAITSVPGKFTRFIIRFNQ